MKKIIYDFGANNGDDVPYYLMKELGWGPQFSVTLIGILYNADKLPFLPLDQCFNRSRAIDACRRTLRLVNYQTLVRNDPSLISTCTWVTTCAEQHSLSKNVAPLLQKIRFS